MKKRKTKSSKITPNYLAILFLAVPLLLSIPYIYLSTAPYKGNTYANFSGDKTIASLYPSAKKTSVAPKFPLYTNLLPAAESTPAPTPTPTSQPQPLNSASIANDFCLQVPVLLYHHIEPLSIAQNLGHAQLTVDSDYFDQQMAYLAANGYHSISAEELADALIRHVTLPPKSILITLDDGYEDNYTYAFQILKKYNIVGNFMISTGLIENKGYMTWNQLKEISGNPLMRIYNHTWSHAYLSKESKEKIQFEIATANDQLKNNLDKNINIFTYPYGAFNQTIIEILKTNGFTAAFSTIHGALQCESYIYALRRTHIGNAPLTSYGL